MVKKIIAFLLQSKTLIVVYLLATVTVSVQSYLLPPKTFEDGGKEYTHFNNYIVFKQSHFHLVDKLNPYASYPDEQWDLYKYSPAFALFFGIFAYLPDYIGLILWNLLNSMLLLLSIYFLPELSNRVKGLILFTILIELITSLQNSQSNALVAGQVILAFGLFERNKMALGTLSIVSSVFIKLFGIVSLILILFYPQKLKTILYLILWTVVFFVAPLIVMDFVQFKQVYLNWYELLASDHAASYGLSVMGWLKTWFGLEINKLFTIIFGAVILCLPMLRIKLYKDFLFSLLMLGSVLIWVVIFNHKSESPTFILAMCGIALWFFSKPPNKINFVLLVLAFVFISLSPTDIFPASLRHNIVIPYTLKVLPAIIIWVILISEMLTRRFPFAKKPVF